MIILGLDSMGTVALINKPKNCRHPFAALLGRIHHLLSCDWEVRVHHAFCKVKGLRILWLSKAMSFNWV